MNSDVLHTNNQSTNPQSLGDFSTRGRGICIASINHLSGPLAQGESVNGYLLTGYWLIRGLENWVTGIFGCFAKIPALERVTQPQAIEARSSCSPPAAKAMGGKSRVSTRGLS